jgi:uncharacterized protein (TIGR02271 family)
MTMHADQLVGAPVTDCDGLAIGIVEQVFRDDADGTPSWARVRSAKGLHFVPLSGSRMTSSGGLSVPFDSQTIMTEPGMNVGRHMSAEQEEQLRSYFGMGVPAQRTGETQPEAAQPEAAQPEAAQPKPAWSEREQPAEATQPESYAASGQPSQAPGMETVSSDQGWLTRCEERFSVNLEPRESGRVRLHKYVDSEPIQETITVYREEYAIERIPVSSDDAISADLGESEQEVILHETRPIVTKETVPIERVRLSVRTVEDEQTVTGELLRERIEIESEDNSGGDDAGGGPSGHGRTGI